MTHSPELGIGEEMIVACTTEDESLFVVVAGGDVVLAVLVVVAWDEAVLVEPVGVMKEPVGVDPVTNTVTPAQFSPSIQHTGKPSDVVAQNVLLSDEG